MDPACRRTRRNQHGNRARRARRPPAGWRPLMALRSDRLDAIVSLSKRRGFVSPSSEIYGGLRASWDYGPLGVELKNNIKRQWWRAMVTERDDIVGLDSSVILAPEVWQGSGHPPQVVGSPARCPPCPPRL